MNSVWLSMSSSRLLFKALKLSIPILQSLPLASDGRSPLSKALSLSILLADLQMDAEVISASILSEVVEPNAISIYEVRDLIGTGTAHLLHQSLKADLVLAGMVEDVYVKGLYKSRYSMMKKLLRDGRKPEEVNDVLGLRVILMPNYVENDVEVGERACYRAGEIIQSLWKEIPHRTKD